MGRRKILLVVAALVAALGTLMVFVHVQGAGRRADQRYDAVEVLQATKPIEAGESFDEAVRASKFRLESVASEQVLEGSQSDLTALSGLKASQAIFPGEQIIAAKWASEVEAPSSLAIPKGMLAISVNLTDPARVAGFVNPGSEVAVFLAGTRGEDAKPFAQLLLQRVQVLGVGTTSTITSTKTTGNGEQLSEELPRTLMTLAVKQRDAERLIYSASNGELAFGLLTQDSTVAKSAGLTAENLFE